MWKFLFLCLFFIIHFSSQGSERSETFIVYLFENKVKVTAPKKDDPKLALLLENKTLTKIIGKIESESGRVLGFVTIEPGKSKTFSLEKRSGEKVRFVPMSPPFQAIDLIIGLESYEIPPKR